MVAIDQAWLDGRAASLQVDRPGATVLVEYTVTGGDDGDVVFHLELTDGTGVARLGGVADADFTMRCSTEDFAAQVSGDLAPEVGYMQGRIKVTGNVGRMLSVLPLLNWVRET